MEIHGEPTRRKRSFYILRHLRGELPLGISFWINYIGGVNFFALFSILLVRAAKGFDLVAQSYVALPYFLSILVVFPWVMVGTWRSASRYATSGGTRFWSWATKLIILVGLYYWGNMVVNQTIPSIGVFSGIITGDKGYPPYDMLVNNHGRIIQFHGGLRAGAEREFKRKMDSSSHLRVLQIESHGGRATAGMRIGRMIRRARLVTVVSTYCESAATYLFISGEQRIVTPGAKIGFHASSGIGGSDAEDVRHFMEEAGISTNFINKVLSTSPDQMWYPTHEEMIQAGVVTGELVDGKIQWESPR